MARCGAASTSTKADKKSGGSLYNFSHSAPSCYESHPPLKLPGTELVIYGGSCLHPKVKDADVYIGFDVGMRRTDRQYPWVAGDEVKFEITDMSIPKDPAGFDKLIDWTKAQMEAGRKVHCGCIGGHGRTGMFLAALCSKFGEKDAISYVRAELLQEGGRELDPGQVPRRPVRDHAGPGRQGLVEAVDLDEVPQHGQRGRHVQVDDQGRRQGQAKDQRRADLQFRDRTRDDLVRTSQLLLKLTALFPCYTVGFG